MGVDPETVGDPGPETVQLPPDLWGQGADDDTDVMGHGEGWLTGELRCLHTPLDTLKESHYFGKSYSSSLTILIK